VVDQECVHPLLSTLTETILSRASALNSRISCAELIAEFCSGTHCKFEEHVPMVLQGKWPHFLNLFGLAATKVDVLICVLLDERTAEYVGGC
jgi:hypothetical protein